MGPGVSAILWPQTLTCSAFAGRLLGRVLAPCLVLMACAVPPGSSAQGQPSAVDGHLVVDCLLPGQRKRIGNKYSYIGPRRPAKTTASECAIRGGEYVEYDRADYRTATAVWMAQAEDGDPVAQNYLGEIYEKGLGTAPDYAAARDWYERAAEQGYTAAQFNLGKLYESGLVGPVDRDKALSWYRKAAGLPNLTTTPELLPAPLSSRETEDAPRIEMIDPQVPETRGISVTPVSESVTERLIIGRARTIDELRSITVNDREVDFEASGIFQTRVPLSGDGTRVNIVAVDAAGRRGTRTFVMSHDAGPLRIDTDFGRYHALVIGNDKYPYMNPLTTAVNDARVVGRVLKERYGFVVTPLENATRAQILDALNHLRKTLTENDNLLIYYAGHGTLDEANDRGHWMPVDARPDSSTEWISNTDLTDILNIMAARHVLVVSDSCYSGSLTRTSATALRSGRTSAQRAADFIALNGKRSRTALTSGGLAPVLDRGRGGHSVFANAFIDALRDNDEVLEGQRLMLRIRSSVAQAAYDRERFEQVPVYAPINLAGHEFGEFFFVPEV